MSTANRLKVKSFSVVLPSFKIDSTIQIKKAFCVHQLEHLEDVIMERGQPELDFKVYCILHLIKKLSIDCQCLKPLALGNALAT